MLVAWLCLIAWNLGSITWRDSSWNRTMAPRSNQVSPCISLQLALPGRDSEPAPEPRHIPPGWWHHVEMLPSPAGEAGPETSLEGVNLFVGRIWMNHPKEHECKLLLIWVFYLLWVDQCIGYAVYHYTMFLFGAISVIWMLCCRLFIVIVPL